MVLLNRSVNKRGYCGTSLAVQWLRLCASTAGGTGPIPGWERSGQQKTNKQTKGDILLT